MTQNTRIIDANIWWVLSRNHVTTALGIIDRNSRIVCTSFLLFIELTQNVCLKVDRKMASNSLPLLSQG